MTTCKQGSVTGNTRGWTRGTKIYLISCFSIKQISHFEDEIRRELPWKKHFFYKYDPRLHKIYCPYAYVFPNKQRETLT